MHKIRTGLQGLHIHTKNLFQTLQKIHWLNWAIGALTILVLPFIYQALIELALLRSFSFWPEYLWHHRHALLPGYIVLVCLFGLVLLLSARPWLPNFILGGLLYIFSFANFYKITYRSEPLLPKDMVQMTEAVKISGEIKIPLTRELWLFLLFWLGVTLLLLPFKLPFARGWKHQAARLCSAGMFAIGLSLYITQCINNDRYMADRRISPSLAGPQSTYYNGTSLSSFLFFSTRMHASPPDNYSQAAVQAAAQALPAKNGRKTDVIMVLLESFYDISTIPGTTFSEPLLPNYSRLAAEGLAGNAYYNIGGGTCNVEFAVLTGFNPFWMPPGSIPYIEYIYPQYPSLPQYYLNQGYRTIAIHPYDPQFYNRDATYANMGFEDFYAQADFAPEDTQGAFIGDEAVAQRIIAEYEKTTSQGQYAFIHAVTMQNHTPYAGASYPASHRVTATSGGSGEYDEALTGLATGIRDTDAMIGLLTEYFSHVDRDVVLLFYGDHQSVAWNKNGGNILEESPEYQAMDETGQWLASHAALYLMWANFTTTDGTAGPALSSDMLAPALFAEYGLSAPPWFNWLGGNLPEWGGCTAGWHLQPGGPPTQSPTPAQQEIIRTQQLLQYDLMFGRRYALQQMYP